MARRAAIIIALVATSPAIAADMAARPYTKAPVQANPIYNWNGLYIGANGGWGSARTCWDLVGTLVMQIPAVPEGCHTGSGGVVGGQIGYNFQVGSLVLGVDAQWDWTRLTASNIPVPFPATFNRTTVNSIGLLDLRAGYAWNNVLAYIKGGAAAARNHFDFGLNADGVPLAATSSTRWGTNIGAGLEYGFATNWSVAVEYNHMFLGRRDESFGPNLLSNTGVVESIKQDLDMVTVRLNYRFGG
jgi:outer membrane immunogenic protein